MDKLQDVYYKEYGKAEEKIDDRKTQIYLPRNR